MMVVAGGGPLSAHRLDEYLQAARLAIDPDRVQLELDLTPGMALAEALLTDIDRNRDGSLSGEEQQTYCGLVINALDLALDGTPLPLQLAATSFPGADAVRRGEGMIRLHATATLPPLRNGVHQLSFRNRYHPERSVYLANALVPDTNTVAITEQRREGDQSALTIEYVLRDATAIWRTAPVLGAAAVASLLLALLLMRALRARNRTNSRRR